jgi:hypothetical protein
MCEGGLLPPLRLGAPLFLDLMRAEAIGQRLQLEARHPAQRLHHRPLKRLKIGKQREKVLQIGAAHLVEGPSTSSNPASRRMRRKIPATQPGLLRLPSIRKPLYRSAALVGPGTGRVFVRRVIDLALDIQTYRIDRTLELDAE